MDDQSQARRVFVLDQIPENFDVMVREGAVVNLRTEALHRCGGRTRLDAPYCCWCGAPLQPREDR